MPVPACFLARGHPGKRRTSPTNCAVHGSFHRDRDAQPFRAAGSPGRRCPSSVLPLPAREPGLDLLEEPFVAIRVAERGVSLIRAILRVPARNAPAGKMEQLADLRTPAD